MRCALLPETPPPKKEYLFEPYHGEVSLQYVTIIENRESEVTPFLFCLFSPHRG